MSLNENEIYNNIDNLEINVHKIFVSIFDLNDFIYNNIYKTTVCRLRNTYNIYNILYVFFILSIYYPVKCFLGII